MITLDGAELKQKAKSDADSSPLDIIVKTEAREYVLKAQNAQQKEVSLLGIGHCLRWDSGPS